MKSCYIFLSLNKIRKDNIESRIKERANACLEVKVPIDFFILNIFENISNRNYFMVKVKQPKNRINRFIKKWFFNYKYIEESGILDRYDIIILRYPLASSIFSRRFYRIYGHKIISEHHTLELEELNSPLATNWALKKYQYFMEKVNQRYCLSKVIGLIGVTDEIINEHDYSGKPTLTLANGVILKKIHIIGNKNYGKGEKLRLAFSSRYFQSWHGLDRLLRSAENYNGSTHLEIHILGNCDSKAEPKTGNCSVIYHGELTGKKYETAVLKSHIGVSTLTLYRIGMEEACSLKSREYLMRGIPFIYGYRDPDIPDNFPFAMRVSNDDSLIDLSSVVEFYENTRQYSWEDDRCQDVLHKISWQYKMKILYEFCQGLS